MPRVAVAHTTKYSTIRRTWEHHLVWCICQWCLTLRSVGKRSNDLNFVTPMMSSLQGTPRRKCHALSEPIMQPTRFHSSNSRISASKRIVTDPKSASQILCKVLTGYYSLIIDNSSQHRTATIDFRNEVAQRYNSLMVLQTFGQFSKIS